MNDSRIRLYVGPEYKEEGMSHLPLMYPFWGIIAKDSMPYVSAAAKQYQFSNSDFELCENISECDFVCIPYDYRILSLKNPEKIATIRAEAKKAHKLLLVDISGDIETGIDDERIVVLRLSQYRYNVRKNEITIPFLAEDLAEKYCNGEPPIRPKKERPIVGFIGWAEIPLKTRIKIFIKEFPLTLATIFSPERGAEHKGILFREKALSVLKANVRIETLTTARKSYSGHVATSTGSQEDNRKQFVENLLESDYALCVKGDANASVRFYEALSLGKIPLFLDTACVLPLEELLDYKSFCVVVDWREISNIGNILTDFHAKCTPEDFKRMQEESRNAFENYLRTDAFSKQLAAQLRARAEKYYALKK